MSSIVTDRFRIKNALEFVESVKSTNFYVTIGEPITWNDDPSRRGANDPVHSDSNPPAPLDSDFESNRSHWEDMIFAKRIVASDVVPMIRRYEYDPNEIYAAYDPSDSELFTKKFHVTVLDNTVSPAKHRVYKCIENGGGNVAGETRPFGSSSQLIEGSNGYRWKFMYTLEDINLVNRLLTPTHIPVLTVKNIGNIFPTENEFSQNSALNKFDFPVSDDGVVGHGYDPVRELGGFFAGVNVIIQFDERDTRDGVTRNKVIRENEYRKIGIVSNPLESDGGIATRERYDQLTELKLSNSNFNTLFQEDEIIEDSAGNEVGIVVEHGAFNGVENDLSLLKIIEINEGVSTGNTIITGKQSGVTSGVNSKRDPELIPNTGDFIFIQQRTPIVRSQEQSESLTLVVEF